jgi:GNAT superfamily N-acetyltransferase
LIRDVIVSTAVADEADKLALLYEWLFAPPGVRPARWTPERGAAAIRRTMASDTAVILVARRGDDLVGFCTAYEEFESVRFGRRVWVEDLAVHPDYRSHGIGKQLLDEAKRWAQQRAADRLALDSSEARTDAHRFYERQHPSWRSVSFGWEL